MTTNAELLARRQAAIVRGVGNAIAHLRGACARMPRSGMWRASAMSISAAASRCSTPATSSRGRWRRSPSSSKASRIRASRSRTSLYRNSPSGSTSSRPIKGPAKIRPVHHRRGSRRERHQDRTRRHRPLRRHRVHAAAFTAAPCMAMAHDRQGAALQEGFGPMLADVCHVPFPIPQHERDGEDFAEGAVASSSRPTWIRRGSRRSSSSRCRAKAGSMPRRPSCMRELRAHLRRARHPAHRRRGAVRFRPHRQDVRDRALRVSSPTSSRGQEPGGRISALRRASAGRRSWTRRARRPRRHLCRQSRSPAPRRWPCST